MSLFKDFFGGTKDQTTTSTNTTRFNTPAWLQAYIDQNTQLGIDELGRLRNTTADQRIEGFNPDEIAAQERIRSGVGQYDDIVGGALSALQAAQGRAFEGVRPEDIQQFMNPFTQNVTDITKRETVRDADVERARMQASAQAASAFGGSGGLLRQMELDRNLGQRLTDIQYKGQSDAFTQALDAARQSTNQTIQAGQAIGNLANTGQNIYNQDTQALAASGEAQRGLDQAKTDFTYTNPLETIIQGQQMTGTALPMYGQTSTGTQTTPVQQSGWGSKLLGTAVAIGSMGTGGGATIGGSLLGSWLGGTPQNKKDGGVVKMKDGGEPMLSSMLQDMMMGSTQDINPTTVMRGPEYKPGTVVPIDVQALTKNLSPAAKSVMENSSMNDELTFPEGMLQPPMVNEKPGQVPSTENPELSAPSSETFSTTAPNRAVPTNTLERQLQKTEEQPTLAKSSLEAMLVPEAKAPEQKSKLQSIIDDTNLPLLKTGLTMMLSDKPFLDAIAEGGLAGAEQIGVERKAAAEAAKREQDALNEQLDRQVKMGQLEELVRNNAERREIARARLDDAKQRTMIAKQNAEVYANRAGNLKGDKKLAFQNLKTQFDGINKRLTSGMVPQEQIASLEETQRQLINEMNNLTGGEGNTTSTTPSQNDVQGDVTNAVNSFLDFSEYKPK